MTAKRTFAVTVWCGLGLGVLFSAFTMVQDGATLITSDPLVGNAQMAVRHTRSQEAQQRLKAQQKALQVERMRSQLEEIEKAKVRKQDEAHARRLARNAAAARAYALGKTSLKSRRERASRDAERARLEAERRKYEGTPRQIARNLLPDHGWSDDQFSCLDKLWEKESNWRVTADNPTSSAYGIPQALPGRRMAEYGADWRTNPVTQIRWGLDYIEDAYGSPCAAWAHSQRHNWY